MANPFTSAQAPAPSPAPSPAMQLIAPDLVNQQISNARIQQLAQLLREKGLADANPTQVIGGWAVKQNPIEGLSKLGQLLAGTAIQQKGDQDSAALQQAFAQRLRDAATGQSSVASMPSAPLGTPNTSMPVDSQQSGMPVPSSASATPMGAPPQPQIPSGDNFNLANLIRGQAISALGGDAMGKAFAEGITPTQMQRENQYLGINPDIAKQMQLAKLNKEGTQSFQPGQLNILPNGQRIVAPDFNSGVAGGFDANGNPVALPIQGADKIAADRAGAVAGAQEGAKVQTYTDPNGVSRVMTNNQALGITPQAIQPGGAAPSYTDVDQKHGFPPGTMASIARVESNNNPNAVSPKGAQGIFQMMPATQQNPGYGLSKLDPNNPEDAASYLGALRRQAGGDLNKAIAMYNAGEKGNLTNPETTAYVKNVTTGINSGQSPQGMQVQSPAQAAQQKKEFETGAEYEANLNSNLSKSQDLLKRLSLTQEALQNFQTGGGKELRASMAEKAQALGLPKTMVDKIAGGDLGAMQITQKLAVQEALQNMQTAMSTDTGAQGRTNKQLIQTFIESNPNLDTDPRAMQKLINFQTQLQNDFLAQSNTLQTYKKEHQGDLTGFPNYWANKNIETGRVKPVMLAGNSLNNGSSPTSGTGVMTPERWAAMKSGDTFIDAQGNTRRKP